MSAAGKFVVRIPHDSEPHIAVLTTYKPDRWILCMDGVGFSSERVMDIHAIRDLRDGLNKILEDAP